MDAIEEGKENIRGWTFICAIWYTGPEQCKSWSDCGTKAVGSDGPVRRGQNQHSKKITQVPGTNEYVAAIHHYNTYHC